MNHVTFVVTVLCHEGKSTPKHIKLPLVFVLILVSENDVSTCKTMDSTCSILSHLSTQHVIQTCSEPCWNWQKMSAVPKYYKSKMICRNMLALTCITICSFIYFITCITFYDVVLGGGSQVVGWFPGGCYDNPVFVPCTSWQPEGLLCGARVRHKHTHTHTYTLPTVDYYATLTKCGALYLINLNK